MTTQDRLKQLGVRKHAAPCRAAAFLAFANPLKETEVLFQKDLWGHKLCRFTNKPFGSVCCLIHGSAMKWHELHYSDLCPSLIQTSFMVNPDNIVIAWILQTESIFLKMNLTCLPVLPTVLPPALGREVFKGMI